MAALRLLAVTIIGGLITLGVFADQRDRDLELPVVPTVLGTPDASVGTWFCAGGSSATGAAAVGLDVINVGALDVPVDIIAIRNDVENELRSEIVATAGERTVVNLTELAPDAAWVGAIVETGSSDVIVEQTFDGRSGTDRAPCATNTAAALFAADGATRVLAEGEEMTLVLLNPFREDAVANVRFDADVGPDRLDAIVVPARRVVAIDVTSEVTVAERVQTSVEVVAGRLVGHRLQVRNGTEVRGLAVTPLLQRGAAVSVLPSVRSDLGVFDQIFVTNPSLDETAEVDLEIVTDGRASLDPVELTVRPGRTAVVNVALESRLAALGEFAVLARSLTGVPVAVSLEREVPLTDQIVPGTSAMPAIDSGAVRWTAVLDGNTAALHVVNPSNEAIAIVDVSVIDPTGATAAQSFELAPGQWRSVDGATLGDRAVVEVEASAPVVVSRELAGFTSRQLLSGVVMADPVSLDQLD
ncbi:MAG: hypothetical protein AAGC53_09545 [Actinomycetota bacterium]